MKFDLNNPRILAITAVMTALVVALTSVRVPTGLGYSHLGDLAIMFTALAFGPWAGLIAGGLGTALADVIGGYGFFAPLTFVVHGLQGLIAGLIYRQMRNFTGMVLAVVVGGVIIVAGYFAGEYLVDIWGGPATAVAEIVPNIGQALMGLLGALVYIAVARAYPPLVQTDSAADALD